MPTVREDEIEFDLDSPDLPFHLLKLQDDLARSRMREAFWISLIFHMIVVFLLLTSPKWMPSWHSGTVIVANPADLMKDKDATFLEMPPDMVKPKVRPQTNIISDKDRIAMARHPDNSKQIPIPRDVMPPGPPQRPGPRDAQPAPQVAQANPAPQNQQQGGQQQRPDNNMVAKLEPPPSASPRPIFGGGVMSPGSAIAQAARAASQSRGGGGAGGDWGLGEGTEHGAVGPADILSDTMGVDFGPYLQRVIHTVKLNWYTLIPEAARAPLLKRGKVSIEFAILKDGSVAGLRIVGPSGDISLDRAAYGGITASNPFQPLPTEFKGQYLALRFHFYYNPAKGEME
ncbi:MAG: TonB family protein [Terriglobales bacterium]